jgi:hypothetical protein
MKAKGLFAGKKIGKHHTLIPVAETVVRTAKALPEVSKILPGIIKNVKTGAKSIKFISIPAGWLIKVRGPVSVQIIYVYSSNPESTKKAILDQWA